MRGRTNVPQRKSPTINGDVQNMTVASGKSVIVGDFVQYKMQEQNDRISGDTSRLLFRTNFKIGQNLFTKQDTDTVKLISNDDLYTVEDNVSGVNHWKLSDGNIVVLYDVYLRLYSVVNKRFNLLQEINIGYKESSSYRFTLVCQLSDGRIVCIEPYVSSSRYAAWFKIFTYASQEISTQYVEFSTNLYSGTNLKPLAITVGNNSSFALFCGSGTSNTSMSIRSFVCGENSITIGDYKYTSGSYGGNVTIMGSNSYCVQMGQITSGYGIEIFKLTSSGLESVYSINPVSYVSKVSQAAGWSAAFVDENKILVAVADGGTTGSESCGYFVIELDDEIITSNVVYKTLTYTQSSTYYNAELLANGTGFINNKGNIFFVWVSGSVSAQTTYSGEYLIMLNYFDGVLEMGTATNYVEKWNGGRALGFAKTGGSNGDTIQVYVPQLSS